MPGADDIEVTQNIFSIITRSVKADSVLGTTSMSYLGKITDPETAATTYCDFMAQFHTMENLTFPAENDIVKTNGKVEADSVEIRLFVSDYYGDELNSMKMGVYELDTLKPMNENMVYYSNIDPWKYVNQREGAIRKELSFAVTDLTLSDSLQNAYSSNKNIRIKLPREYGTFLMRKYYDNPANYSTAYNFIHHVCPGFYYRIISGNGTMLSIDAATLTVYFRYVSGDSILSGVQRMATTEEVLQNTRIENKNLEELLSADGYTYLKTPVGIYTEATIPVDSIYDEKHTGDTLNSAKVSFGRLNDKSLTDYNLPVPKQILMLKAADLYEFFEESKVADGKTSYVTTYSSSENAYTFSNISALVSNMYDTRRSGAGVKPTDSKSVIQQKYAKWEADHPSWNKVLLVPVTTEYSTTSVNGMSTKVLSRVRNDLSLSSTRLIGGGSTKISVIYSKFRK